MPTADMVDKQCGVIVIGAGVAGCAIAVALAKSGQEVLLIERSLQEPNRIVGELLQPGGIQCLQKLGLDHCLEGIQARPVKGYHLYWRDQETSFWFCPPNPQASAAEGRSFHHGKFVMNLRRPVKSTQGIRLIEATVSELIINEETGNVTGVLCYRQSEDTVAVSSTPIFEMLRTQQTLTYPPRTPVTNFSDL